MATQTTRNRLIIDLKALAANYRYLARCSHPAVCGAVVKDNAYGLGTAEVASALYDVGARVFFVATPQEGVELCAILANAKNIKIYILGGILPGEQGLFVEHNLRPALVSTRQVERWNRLCYRLRRDLPAGIHVNSGVNRLGMTPDEAEQILVVKSPRAFTPELLMSHLATADEPGHPQTVSQLATFSRLRTKFLNLKASLANSAAILTEDHQKFVFDLTRPGIALYGANPLETTTNPLQTVVTFQARIIQTLKVSKGATIGYGAGYHVKRDSLLAIAAFGYGDGYLRAAGSHDNRTGAWGFGAGVRIPIIGRVSMDLTALDITDIGENRLGEGDWLEVFGANIDINQVARQSNTISNELLSGLSSRIERHYLAV